MARTMSDPVTNVEIEDVLSSIRRLVSEEGRPPRGAPRPMSEKLVLSPSLRVPDTDIEDPPEPTETPPHDELREEPAFGGGTDTVAPVRAPIVLTDGPVRPPHEPDAAVAAESALVLEPKDQAEQKAPEISDWQDTRVAELATGTGPADATDRADAPLNATDDIRDDFREGVDDFPNDPVPEDFAEAEQLAALRASLSGMLLPDADPEEDVTAEEISETGGQDNAALSDCMPDDAPDDEPDDAPDDAPDRALDRKIATLEQILKQQSRDWAPAAPDIEDTADQFAADLPDDAQQEAAVSTGWPGKYPSAIETPAPDNVTEVSGADPMPEAASLEADAATNDPNDPVAAPAAFMRHATTEALDWEDHAPSETTMPEPHAIPESPLDASSPKSNPLADVSEEALQAIVSEIVRQELQGALGERITRNVRKLVRREIHRVLVSKDFD